MWNIRQVSRKLALKADNVAIELKMYSMTAWSSCCSCQHAQTKQIKHDFDIFFTQFSLFKIKNVVVLHNGLNHEDDDFCSDLHLFIFNIFVYCSLSTFVQLFRSKLNFHYL